MSLTVERRDPAPNTVSDAAFIPSLPQTVAQRRNARLRAAALRTIPCLLFVVATALRLWEPDLVPFGVRQAEYVSEANTRAPLSLLALYGDLSASPLMLVWPLLRELPQSVLLWVVLRGLLDSLGVALLFLAARPLVGVWGALLAALLYAVNPTVWAAARDPAGLLTAPLTAAALYGAVRLVCHSSLPNGAILGVLLGLLARSIDPSLIVVLLGASALAVARASWKVGGMTALALVLAAGPALLGAFPPINDRALLLGSPLALPAWLMEGYPFRYLGGVPPHWSSEPGISLPWLPSPDYRSHGTLAHAFSPTLLLLVYSIGVGLLLAWRGHLRLLLPLLWVIVWTVIGYPLVRANPSELSSPIRSVLGFGGPLGFVPVLAVHLVAPIASWHTVLRWLGALAVIGMLLVGGYSLVQDMRLAARAEYARPAFREPSLDGVVPPDPFLDLDGALFGTPSLREQLSLSRALVATVARTAQSEFVVPDQRAFHGALPRASALDTVFASQRPMPVGVVPLPLERETVYLVARAPEMSRTPVAELRRPASSTVVFTPSGADTGAQLVTLRPRSVTSWTAGAIPIPDGRFNDGSRLLSVSPTEFAPDGLGLDLYWLLPVAAHERSVGERVQVTMADARPDLVPQTGHALPASAQRRADELIVLRTGLPSRPGTSFTSPVVVRLLDASGVPILRPDGSTALVLPVSPPAR